MNFMDIKPLDIANGPGCRVSLFVSGCRRHCDGCFNAESWDFNNGEPYTDLVELKLLNLVGRDEIKGLSILGGEPLEPENVETIYGLLKSFRDMYPKGSGKTVWLYTGYTVQEVFERPDTRKLLDYIDILVAGEFMIDRSDLRLQFCGSKNQNVVDVPSTLESGRIKVHDLYKFDDIVYDMGSVDGKSERTIKVGQIYRHFKGWIIQIVSLARHTESEEDLVVYKKIDPVTFEDIPGQQIWARPMEMFLNEVDHEKYPNVFQKYRFDLIRDV